MSRTQEFLLVIENQFHWFRTHSELVPKFVGTAAWEFRISSELILVLLEHTLKYCACADSSEPVPNCVGTNLFSLQMGALMNFSFNHTFSLKICFVSQIIFYI
ncbi:hypothetical protein C0J52_27285 [Blattella germanica]|nr:hypothetical protein C0J52_27285 [Blattella germanica]